MSPRRLVIGARSGAVAHARSAARGCATEYGDVVADPVPITHALDSMMKSLRGTDRIQVGGVFGKWDDAVGEQIAAHVRPIKLDQGTLLVEADTATWATQVKFLGDTIITRLRDEARVEVSRIDVRVASRRRR